MAGRCVVDVASVTFTDNQHVRVYSMDCVSTPLVEAEDTSRRVTVPGAVVWFVDQVEATDNRAILVTVSQEHMGSNGLCLTTCFTAYPTRLTGITRQSSGVPLTVGSQHVVVIRGQCVHVEDDA